MHNREYQIVLQNFPLLSHISKIKLADRTITFESVEQMSQKFIQSYIFKIASKCKKIEIFVEN